MTLSAKKAARIVRDFTSFDREAKGILQLISQLHTSRVSAFGFTAEADVLTVTEYQISAQLDNRVCPVCAEQHGKTFEVERARQLLDLVVFEENPEQLKSLQPWPSQKAQDVETLSRMSREEIYQRGWHIPPYHPWCRCILVQVGEVPDIDRLERTIADMELPPREGPVDRDQIRQIMDLYPELSVNAPWESEILGGAWDAVFKNRSAGDVLQRFNAMTANRFGIKGQKATLTVRASRKAAQQKSTWDHSVAFKFEDTSGFGMIRIFNRSAEGALTVVHDYMKLPEDLRQQGLAKQMLRQHLNFYRELGVQKIELYANIDVGGYAWAKYGFKPTVQRIKYLVEDLTIRLKGLWDDLTAGQRIFVQRLIDDLADGNRDALYHLANISSQVGPNRQKLGWLMLRNQGWDGELDMTDPVAMERMFNYIGGA